GAAKCPVICKQDGPEAERRESLPSAICPEGMKTNAFILARAAYAAIEAEVLPVLAQATPVARSRFACVMPVVIPKSLNDPVGFIPRCLNDRRFILAYVADRGASQIGV